MKADGVAVLRGAYVSFSEAEARLIIKAIEAVLDGAVRSRTASALTSAAA